MGFYIINEKESVKRGKGGRQGSKIDNVMHFARRLVKQASVDYWHSSMTGQSVRHTVLRHLLYPVGLTIAYVKSAVNVQQPNHIQFTTDQA